MLKVILAQTCFAAYLKLKPVFLMETHWVFKKKHMEFDLSDLIIVSDTAAKSYSDADQREPISSAHNLCLN